MKHTRKKALAVLSAILLLLSGTVQSVLAEEAAVPTSAEKADATATEKVLSDLGVEEGSLELPCKSAILMKQRRELFSTRRTPRNRCRPHR